MAAVLRAALPFSAWGVSYLPGDEVTEEHLKQWPEGTLETRMAGGYIKYVRVAVEQTEVDKLSNEEVLKTAAELGIEFDKKKPDLAALRKQLAEKLAGE